MRVHLDEHCNSWLLSNAAAKPSTATRSLQSVHSECPPVWNDATAQLLAASAATSRA